MGLLDSMLGQVLGGAMGRGGQPQAGGGADLGSLLGGLLGGGQQQQAGAGGLNAGALAALLPVVMGMLANNNGQGGVGGLLDKFRQAGMGDRVDSWVGTGENAPIQGHEMTQALGEGTLGDLAKSVGLPPEQTADGLAQLLPGLIDKFTPQGQLPQGGLGNNADELMAALGGLLGRR